MAITSQFKAYFNYNLYISFHYSYPDFHAYAEQVLKQLLTERLNSLTPSTPPTHKPIHFVHVISFNIPKRSIPPIQNNIFKGILKGQFLRLFPFSPPVSMWLHDWFFLFWRKTFRIFFTVTLSLVLYSFYSSGAPIEIICSLGYRLLSFSHFADICFNTFAIIQLFPKILRHTLVLRFHMSCALTLFHH